MNLDEVDLVFVDSIDKVWAMKRWLGELKDTEFLGIDLETTGLNPRAPGAGIRLIQIGDDKTGWAVPWVGWGGAALECCKLWKGRFTGHNLIDFDDTWLRMFSDWHLPQERTDDTFIMASIERPGQPNDLKPLSDKFVDPRASAGQKELKLAFKNNGWGWVNVPLDFPAYWIYSALDPVIAVALRKVFNTDKKFREAYDMEMAVRHICNNMERVGMRVDLDYSKIKYEEITEKANKRKAWAQENWGINIASNEQLADFYANRLGAEFSYYTEKGAPSVKADQMEEFMEHPGIIGQSAKFILETRKIEKVANSYFKNFLSMNIDGIVHPTIKTMGARTGRMSVTNPALQTIPSKDSLVRTAFLPNNPGEFILSCDYSQVEMRLLAHFSGDKALQQAFRDADASGEDFFTNLGKQIYSDPSFEKSDPRRKLVKGTLYGLIYGAGTQKMADTAEVTYEEMFPVVEVIHKTFPGIRRFMKEVEKLGTLREEETGTAYIVTGTGRHLPADKGKIYSLVNYTLQGTAAELMKKAIIRLDAAGYGPYMRMVIHDEVVFSMPEEMLEQAEKEIPEIMSYTNGEFEVDLLADVDSRLTNWGSKYANAA